MTATKKNPSLNPPLTKADAARCFSCALNPQTFARTLDRTFDAISPYPHRI
ncbi:MAG TPA: hypothetical protein VGG81_04110 [Edaphobacter sp.]|jgi:hypothetical protein